MSLLLNNNSERKISISITLTVQQLNKIDKLIREGKEETISKYIRKLIDKNK